MSNYNTDFALDGCGDVPVHLDSERSRLGLFVSRDLFLDLQRYLLLAKRFIGRLLSPQMEGLSALNKLFLASIRLRRLHVVLLQKEWLK